MYLLKKSLIIATFFLITLAINSCGIYKKTDAPVNVDDRVRKNIEEGRGVKFGDKRKIGKVSKVNGDIVFVKLSDIDVRKNMELTGWSTYYFGPGNDGYKNSLEDYNNAINYIKNS